MKSRNIISTGNIGELNRNTQEENNLNFLWKVDLMYIMFNSRVSSQKLGATDTALCSPSLNKVKQNLGDSNE